MLMFLLMMIMMMKTTGRLKVNGVHNDNNSNNKQWSMTVFSLNN